MPSVFGAVPLYASDELPIVMLLFSGSLDENDCGVSALLVAEIGFDVAFSMRAQVRYTSKRRRRVPRRIMER